jgi:hypothetical protein
VVNVVATGAPSKDDLQSLKDFSSEVSQACLSMQPTYVIPKITTNSIQVIDRRGREVTRTTTTTYPNYNLMKFNYLPRITFGTIDLRGSAVLSNQNDFSSFYYDFAGNIEMTQSFLSIDQESQSQRDIAMKRYLLQALGLFGTTSNKSANAFLAGNSSWDGTLSDFDRELIALHCSAAVPSYKTAPEISASLQKAISTRSTAIPSDSYNVVGSATDTTATFVVSAPSIDHQIAQGVDHLNYSVVDDSGTTLDSGTLLIGTELFRGSWSLNYSNLNPYTTYTISVTPENAAGMGPTTSYGLFTWNYGNL